MCVPQCSEAGIDPHDESSLPHPDPAVLMSVMELREDIERASSARDEDALGQLLATVESAQRDALRGVEASLAEHNAEQALKHLAIARMYQRAAAAAKGDDSAYF